MIPLLLAVAASASPVPPAPTPFAECIALVDKDPVKAIDYASAWRLRGGDLDARQCLGLAFAAQQRWAAAAVAFEQAAQEAEKLHAPRSGQLWMQAGNASLAGGDFPKARLAFDAALAGGQLRGADQGEAHLDRARAAVAVKDSKAARADLDAAIKLVPEDALAWLLSATLARRDGDLARALADIAEAAKRSPDDASVAFEAGNIAALSGADGAARTAWEAAVKASPESPAGKAAAASLKQLGGAPSPSPK
jgi:tetratricopeptide (TPR) repeat protein